MALTFAKSVRFGGIRFNFTGSGIGVSGGIPGLRIGTGPRGAYISGGVGGFRYRKSLGTKSSSKRAAQRVPARVQRFEPGLAPALAQIRDSNVLSEVHHDTKDVLALNDSDGDDLLQTMNEQRSRTTLWPFISGAVGICVVLAYSRWPALSPVVFIGLALAWVALTFWLAKRDQVRRLTVLFYDPDSTAAAQFAALSHALTAATRIMKVRAVASTSQYADTRYSAGAGQGLKFQQAALTMGQAPGILANIAVPILATGGTTLAFYPDRVLAFRGNAVGAIDYERLSATSGAKQFVEDEALPADATVVGHTWRYVNKNGTPDRRFKDNRQMPICRYNEMNLSTPGGLDVRFLGSRDGGFGLVASALADMRAAGVARSTVSVR